MNSTNTEQRRALLRAGGALLLAGLPAWAGAATDKPLVEVWKTATCGCCKDWIRHLQIHGFEVTAHDVGEPARREMRQRLGLSDAFGSCHTARVGGYVVEGHVPARDIFRLLRERPTALGLAVPGMPVGAPGMDGPEYGGQKDPYSVLLVRAGGSSTIFQSYR